MSDKPYILAHDLGTTGNKATLFDADGHLLHSAFAAYETAYPQPGWAEQNPADWWQAVCSTTRSLLAETNAPPQEIAAVGFSGQMMGCLPVDAAGGPLRTCIIWADTRAQSQAKRMAELCGADTIYRHTGHPASPNYSAPKYLWLREHQPELFNRTACFLQPKDYVVLQLTGALATDYSDASGTLLFDLAARTWRHDFLVQLDLAAELLPPLHPSTAVAGQVTARAAADTGLAAGTPVVIGGGDGACAGVGAGVIEAGDAYCNIGSSAWISVASDAPIPDPQQRTVTFHHVHPQRYCPMGTMLAAGGARDWAWEILGEPALDLDKALHGTVAGAGSLLFLPYLLGERSPYWNPLARGAFVGLTMSHSKADMARAVLEGVALHLRLILDALAEQTPGISAMRLIGGGSRSPLWRQILANCFRLPVHTLDLQAGATSWGAAVAAGVGIGLYDWSIASARSQVQGVTEPDEDLAEYDRLAALFADTYAALAPIYARLGVG